MGKGAFSVANWHLRMNQSICVPMLNRSLSHSMWSTRHVLTSRRRGPVEKVTREKNLLSVVKVKNILSVRAEQVWQNCLEGQGMGYKRSSWPIAWIILPLLFVRLLGDKKACDSIKFSSVKRSGCSKSKNVRSVQVVKMLLQLKTDALWGWMAAVRRVDTHRNTLSTKPPPSSSSVAFQKVVIER